MSAPRRRHIRWLGVGHAFALFRAVSPLLLQTPATAPNTATRWARRLGVVTPGRMCRRSWPTAQVAPPQAGLFANGSLGASSRYGFFDIAVHRDYLEPGVHRGEVPRWPPEGTHLVLPSLVPKTSGSITHALNAFRARVSHQRTVFSFLAHPRGRPEAAP